MIRRIVGVLLPVLWLTAIDYLADQRIGWHGVVVRLILSAGLALLVDWHGRRSHPARRWIGCGLGVLAASSLLIYLVVPSTAAAWGAFTGYYALILLCHREMQQEARLWLRWMNTAVLAALAMLPVLLVEIESSFAEEELFVFGQALVLGVAWLLLTATYSAHASPLPAPMQTERRRNLIWMPLVGLLLLSGAGIWGVLRFQHSFFPADAPPYTGIDAETPFLCGESEPAETVFDGNEVFAALLQRIDASPHKGTPEYGMLALGNQDRDAAEEFRSALLADVAANRFTGAANSLKSIQYDAVLRLYYYDRVRAQFPDLFSQEEQAEVAAWFAAINRRTMTVEWIDWLYALAFGVGPQGPYLNQETGAGLIALLEATDLAAPELRTRNQAFLAEHLNGWDARFRYIDDAIVYQPIWINNAAFQSRYTGNTHSQNQQLAFEWLLLQSLPDGAVLQYNYPLPVAFSGVYSLAADLLADPRYVWLAGRSLAHPSTADAYVLAQPGAERAYPGVASSPTQGSCLLYANSGLPNQAGPLAPDKIVLRDGWERDDGYLLLNLRFSGYHRYKATNTVSLLYAERPLVVEKIETAPLWWLPQGRQLLRDKRIPRENLNGLLVPSTGMHRLLTTFTGIGSPWAQDPPYYAEVVGFETGAEFDQSHTQIKDWHGWQHDRLITFYHDQGPIVVVDQARGPSMAALVWHLAGTGNLTANRYRFEDGDAELVLLGQEKSTVTLDRTTVDSLSYETTSPGEVALVSVFLQKQWVGATVEQMGDTLYLSAPDGQQIILSLPQAVRE